MTTYTHYDENGNREIREVVRDGDYLKNGTNFAHLARLDCAGGREYDLETRFKNTMATAKRNYYAAVSKMNFLTAAQLDFAEEVAAAVKAEAEAAALTKRNARRDDLADDLAKKFKMGAPMGFRIPHTGIPFTVGVAGGGGGGNGGNRGYYSSTDYWAVGGAGTTYRFGDDGTLFVNDINHWRQIAAAALEFAETESEK